MQELLGGDVNTLGLTDGDGDLPAVLPPRSLAGGPGGGHAVQ